MKEPHIWVIERRDSLTRKWKPFAWFGVFFTRRRARETLKLYPRFSNSRALRIRKYLCHTGEEKHKW